MKTILNLSIDSNLKNQFDEYTKKHAINKSGLIRLWIKEYLESRNEESGEVNDTKDNIEEELVI